MARMERIQIRVEEKVRKKIEKAADKEGVLPTEFYRRVFEWAFDQYVRVGDLSELRMMSVSGEKQKSVRRGKETI